MHVYKCNRNTAAQFSISNKQNNINKSASAALTIPAYWSAVTITQITFPV